MTRLTGDALREIAGKVFGERSTTLIEASADYEMDDLTSAVRAMRRMMRSSLTSLPETAFDAQPAAEGEDAWSAGQIVAHIANSQASMSGAVRSLFGMPEAVAVDRYDLDDSATLPTRDEALDILAKADTGFDAFVSDVPANTDLTKAMPHERFGEMNGKSWMLLMAIHEADHLRQVQTLAG